MTIHDCKDLDDYLKRYGKLLASQAQASLNPLHVPSRDKPVKVDGIARSLYEAQSHVVSAGIKAFNSGCRTHWFTTRVGTGKTTLAIATIHGHSGGGGYRVVVMCPPILVEKWKREILDTLPQADVSILESYHQVMKLWGKRDVEVYRPSWYVISRERAKMGSAWDAAYFLKAKGKVPHCCNCGMPVLDEDGIPVSPEQLGKVKMFCMNMVDDRLCGSPLWSYVRDSGRLDHWEPSRLIHKKLRGFFDYAVFDEAHECAKPNSLQANALGSIAAGVKRTIVLTGTIFNGYAESIRPLLFRLNADTLRSEGHTWSSPSAFNEMYGRIETKITETWSSESTATGRGKKKTNVVKSTKPGIMPALFGRHMMGHCSFLSLEEMSDDLPQQQEQVIGLDMDSEMEITYRQIEEELRAAVIPMISKGDQRLLGTMLETLLYYPDYPMGWGDIGYYDGYGSERRFVQVTTAPDMGNRVRPKELAIIDSIREEMSSGRQCWVYVQRTGERDYLQNLADKIQAGIPSSKVVVLRSDSPSAAKREAWIMKNGPGVDVILSHPQLVETGLDLFCKSGRYNFCTLMFAQMGYRLPTLRQAAGRAWRLMQTKACKTLYFYYRGTMQDRALSLMGQKMAASLAIEGTFSTDGLLSMGAEDDIKMAIAKSIAKQMPIVPADRAWSKIVSSSRSRSRAANPRKASQPVSRGFQLSLF